MRLSIVVVAICLVARPSTASEPVPTREQIAAQLEEWTSQWDSIILRFEEWPVGSTDPQTNTSDGDLHGSEPPVEPVFREWDLYFRDGMRLLRRESRQHTENNDLTREIDARPPERPFTYTARYLNETLKRLTVIPRMGAEQVRLRLEESAPRFRPGNYAPLAALRDGGGNWLFRHLDNDYVTIDGEEEIDGVQCVRATVADHEIWFDPTHNFQPIRLRQLHSDGVPAEWQVTRFSRINESWFPWTGWLRRAGSDDVLQWEVQDVVVEPVLGDGILAPPEPQPETKVSGWELTRFSSTPRRRSRRVREGSRKAAKTPIVDKHPVARLAESMGLEFGQLVMVALIGVTLLLAVGTLLRRREGNADAG